MGATNLTIRSTQPNTKIHLVSVLIRIATVKSTQKVDCPLCFPYARPDAHIHTVKQPTYGLFAVLSYMLKLAGFGKESTFSKDRWQQLTSSPLQNYKKTL